MTNSETVEGSAALVANRFLTELAPGRQLRRYATGSVPVFALGDSLVLKLFPADEREFFETECAALARVHGAIRIPTPKLHASGRSGDWWYVVMSQLEGQQLSDVWESIPDGQKLSLMRQVGAAVAELHVLSTDGLSALDANWPSFARDQQASAVKRQQEKKLDARWLRLIAGQLQRFPVEADTRPVLLHTELMREHVLVERVGAAWVPSGLVDFEPAMIGPAEYELASVGIFLTGAQPALFREFLKGYGHDCDEELPLRLLSYTLVHRYSNFPRYFRRNPVPEGVRTLEEVASHWFGFDV